jgi:hypothetical protein
VPNDAIGHERRDATLVDELDLGRIQYDEIVDANGRRRRWIMMRAAGDRRKQYQRAELVSHGVTLLV